MTPLEIGYQAGKLFKERDIESEVPFSQFSPDFLEWEKGFDKGYEESEVVEEDDSEEWEQPCHCHESLTLAECPNHRVNAKMLEYNP